LLADLAAEEQVHVHTAQQISQVSLTSEESASEKRRFALQVVQPGLAGLMDGSVSTLAPLFAAVFATHHSWPAFLVGLAASLGAGISMGFAEALSDDGTLTGRGHPWARGAVCGSMTAAGGLGHTLPFLIANVHTATTVALAVVCVELGIISWIRHRYMDTPLTSAVLQVGLGGALVFLVGVLIGSS
jgi:erythrin-vacuolar iron transport family protein